MNRKLDTIFSDLYQKHSPYMYGVCLRYANTKEDAEDIMQEGFLNVYNGLEGFKKKANIKSWMVRIMINTAIRYYYSKSVSSFAYNENTIGYLEWNIDNNTIEQLSAKELLEVLRELPNGYRIVFNLYCIEGYKHKEIAKMLSISENTSKSQLKKARAYAKKLLAKKLDIKK